MVIAIILIISALVVPVMRGARGVVKKTNCIGAILITLLVTCFAHRKWRVALLAVVVFHLHLLCDLVGSRGLLSLQLVLRSARMDDRGVLF